MTCILLNLPEDYQSILEILEDRLYDEDNPLNIERIREKNLVKFDHINKKSILRTSRKDEKPLYIKSQYKVTCMTCGKYGHKSKYLWHIEGANLPKYPYCDKP